jgi:predicted nucleic acid-binding protein
MAGESSGTHRPRVPPPTRGPIRRIDRLDLLVSLTKLLGVPEAVIREIQAGSDRDGTANKIKGLASILQVDDRPVPDQIRSWDLGVGESQVLAHGLELPGSEVVLDDLAARRCARSLGLSMIGTLGIVVLCRHRGVISAARPVMETLREAGLRLKPALMDEALAKVGE